MATTTRRFGAGNRESQVVLEPFMGSGSTAIAAVETGRHYVGYDLDPEYIALAQERLRTAAAAR